ncbi:hypothetical protein MTR67_044886 [Solanum verrucosum]|uniref:Uncharacterized protein n=1 Tax=Solanum verrucosum TaxID=315347 RepID=A0AAF0UU96_SOLVR|nr:hypothetical protein MTR67_044886 [Solanum verrucosum]
MHLELAWVVC